MNRLKLVNKKIVEGKPILKNLIYPIIKKESDDSYIISSASDRMDLLAKKYYGDDTLYWVIARCNGIRNSLYVTPGIQLCIPNKSRLPNIINTFVSINGR